MSPSHRFARMSGRDPAEQHRTSTPLELLFEKGHWSAAIAGFRIGVLAILQSMIHSLRDQTGRG